MNEKPKRPLPDGANTREMNECEVDENIAGSFPASDPPAWTTGTDHKNKTGDRKSDKEKDRH